MKLTPQQAPLYGKCLISVQLCDEELLEDEEEGLEFYLLFVGSTQSHLTSTFRSSHDTLQALCPAHDCCEVVRVTLCSSKPGRSGGMKVEPLVTLAKPLAEQSFSFIQDLAFDMAQFLVSTAGRRDGLQGALLLDECQIPLQECERLDQSLALALHHLTLPPAWSLLGRPPPNSTEPEPQETLLHFAARRGLRRVAGFLLLQSGAREALRLPNKQGHTPAGIAQHRGHGLLHQLLTQAETNAEPDRRTEDLPLVPTTTDARVECHLPSLDTHTLTLGRAPGAEPPDLCRAVEQLRHLICHHYAKGVPSLQLQPESLHTARACCESSETEQACLKRPRQPDSPDTLAQGCEDGDGERTDGGPSLAPSTSERLPDNGQGVTENRVCLDPNRLEDYHKAGEKGEEEGGEEEREEAGGGVVDWKSVSNCSDKLQGQPGGESCGNDQEETDTDKAVIRVTQGTTEGTDQERDDRTAEGEDGKHSEQSALAASAMGQAQSLENSDISESSDSDMKERSQEDMDVRSDPDRCDTPHLKDDELEREELTGHVSSEMGLPEPSPNADASDVIQEVTPEAGCPRLTIGGHRASSGTNSSEQSQETAVGDYSIDKQQGDCPAASQTHRRSGECAENQIGQSDRDVELVSDKELELSEGADVFDQGAPTISDINSPHLPFSEPADHEENSLDYLVDSSTSSVSIDSVMVTKISNCRPLPVTMIISGNSRSEGDSGTAFSSDEEDTFRSFNSSLTEIFHLSEDADRANVDGQQDFDGFKMAEEQDLLETEKDMHDLGFPLMQSGDTLTVTNCEETFMALLGAEPACCPLSPGHHTMEPLIPEEAPVTRLEPPLAKPSLELVSAGSGVDQSVEISENPHITVDITASHLGLKVVEDLSPSTVLDGSEATIKEKEEAQPPENSLSSEVVSGEESTNPSSDLWRSSGHTSKTTANAGRGGAETEEGSRLLDGQPAKDKDLNLSRPQSDDVTVDLAASTVTAGVFTEDLASSGNSVSEELSTEEVVPDVTTDRVEEAHQSPADTSSQPISPQEVVVSMAEDLVDGPSEQASDHAAMIHRDKQQAAYPVALSPCEQTPTSDGTDLRPSACPSVSSVTHRDSGSDTESFFSTEAGEDNVFRKGEDSVTGGDSTSEVSVSCSSTDDAASVGPASSSPDSCVEGPGPSLRRSWSPEDSSEAGAAARGGGGGGGGGGGETEEEAKDRLTEVPRRSAILRPSIRSLSPFRRHSWGPGKGGAGEADMNQRSSIRSPGQGKPTFHRRSYSLEGLLNDDGKSPSTRGAVPQEPFLRGVARQHSEERGSLVSLTEEHESDLGERSGLEGQKSRRYRPLRHSCPPMTMPLTKSVSMLAISQRETDAKTRIRHKRRISFSLKLSPILPKPKTILSVDTSSSEDEEDDFSMRSFSSASGSLAYSISEEEPGPLRSDSEGKSGTKVSRTFSYLKSKMYKKTREKEGGKSRDKEAKEREKRTLNGHLFTIVNSAHLRGPCHQCNKAINTKEAFLCTNCNAHVHKACRENLPVCAKVKMKLVVSDSSTLPVVTLRAKPTGIRERPRSAILCPEEHPSLVLPSRRHTSIMPFGHGGNLSKSISISNIAGPVFDDIPIKGLRYLSQSTDSLHKNNLVNESTESLTDEGTEMMDSQLMGEFEAEVKDLEADSWTFTVEESYLRQLDKDVIKRQDVIYELIQTEMHHVRTLRIMAEVYSKGLQKEVQLEAGTVERLFPVLDELLELHTIFFSRLLERKKDSQLEGEQGGLAIHRIADVLVQQFSGSNAECIKRIYGKFCSRHNEATNFYKELLTKDKRFQAFIKKKMSSSIVRRLGIPECILLVTQRITKYPVLMQRILQHTNEEEEDHADLTEALRLLKEVLAAVDSKVNDHEKKKRLKDIYSRTDSKSIMRMKSGQMFAREDLVRGRRLVHDGPLQLKNTQGRLKDVQALLLSDIFIFLQEKDQKYVFASLDQRSTVISLQKLIVREVANEERGLFLITAGIEKPEMVEVLASSKEERNTWMQLIQDAMHSMEKDEDEGIPSETEEDRRQLETKAKEMRDMLRKKDDQILGLLLEKMKVFRDMGECGGGVEEPSPPSPRAAVLFRASREDVPRGEPIMKDALQEVETLQALVSGSLGGAVSAGQQGACVPEAAGGAVGPVCLPRRAETFGGFDSHQMNISKNGDKEEEVDAADLRRTESDSVLKKGGQANLLLLLKRNSEQVLHSVTHLHDLLNTLQAVVVQQDTFIEDQRQALTDRPPSASSSASSSRASSRPNSLIEQEKQRSLEKHRQEMAALQRQQAAHADEKRRREREWDLREQQLTDREVLVHVQEEEMGRRHRELEEERQELQARKEDYQKDLERLRDAQRKLDRDRETVLREMEQLRLVQRMQRTPSSTSEDSLAFQGGGGGLSLEPGEWAEPGDPEHSSPPRPETKSKAKSLNPFSVRSSAGQSSENQMPSRLLQLARPKDKKEKKKKKGKGQASQAADSSQHLPEPALDGEIFFC